MENVSNNVIIFKEVTKNYSRNIGEKSRSALINLSFSLQTGSTLGLIGVNGAGKSTSIRLMMDFIRPDKGTVQVFNQQPTNSTYRGRIGYLPETASFPANLTILDLLRFTGNSCDIPSKIRKERENQLLEELNLWEARRKPLRTYSKGMQQRANFTLALLNNPSLLILDEPMSGLDPMGRKKIIELIVQLKNAGKTILFCSHILDDVDKLVDNILLLHKGKKLFYGTPTELTEQEGKTSMADAFVRLVTKEDCDA